MAKKKWAWFLLLIFLLLSIIGIFLLTPNMTGNFIGGLDTSSSNIFGVIFIVIGVLGYYFVYRFLGDYL